MYRIIINIYLNLVHRDASTIFPLIREIEKYMSLIDSKYRNSIDINISLVNDPYTDNEEPLTVSVDFEDTCLNNEECREILHGELEDIRKIVNEFLSKQ